MKRRYDVVFRSTTVTFKAIRCWLNLELSDRAPKHWFRKRQVIDEQILSLTRCPKKEATIEEVGPDETAELIQCLMEQMRIQMRKKEDYYCNDPLL